MVSGALNGPEMGGKWRMIGASSGLETQSSAPTPRLLALDLDHGHTYVAIVLGLFGN